MGKWEITKMYKIYKNTICKIVFLCWFVHICVLEYELGNHDVNSNVGEIFKFFEGGSYNEKI